jgi:hypothetical protein
MEQFLNVVYDQDVYDRRTNKHGNQIITGPFVQLLACTVPDWVTRYLKTNIITGGFSRRTVFVMEDPLLAKRVPRPSVTTEMLDAFARCVERGRQLKGLFGPFTWEPEASAWYDNWYMSRKVSSNIASAYFEEGVSTQMVKVAMLLELCRSDQLVLHLDTLQLALSMLGKIVLRLPEIFSGLGRNELAQVSAKLEAKLRREGRPLTMGEVKEFLWREANSTEIYQVIEHMKSTGTLTVLPDPTVPTRNWLLLTESLAAYQASLARSQLPPASTTSGSSPVTDPPPEPTSTQS